MMRWDVINQLIEQNNYKSYLEIGYYKGWSFDNVKCEEKTAVDPNPCKTPDQEAWPYLTTLNGIWKMTSDDAFAMGIGETWDIIFIDGLHEWKQVLKDVENALICLSPGGRIILHDCNPPTAEHTTTGVDGCWTGDVYKAIIHLGTNIPCYDFYTIDTDWGVGILNPAVQRSRLPVCVQMYEHISPGQEWIYFDRHRKSILNLISVEEFKAGVRFIKNETTTNNNSPA